MKKIISTSGIVSGKINAFWTNRAIRERVDNRLTFWFKQNYGENIQVIPSFTYEVSDGLVTVAEISYTIDNPTPQRLEYFREACENLYELHGFRIDNDTDSPRVYFRATDIFDMASLIHALDYLTVSLEVNFCAVDAGLTEKDAIYSPSGAWLIQLPDIPYYRIKEGTCYISSFAARHCTQLRKLDVPVDMIFDEDSLQEYPKGLQVKEWDTHYDGTPVEKVEDSDDDMPIFDDYDVGYSNDGKILTGCRSSFTETHYVVPDGVEVIEFGAFFLSRHYVELSIPRSVRVIGDDIFGNGGQIVIRDE